MMRENRVAYGEISTEWAAVLWRGFLRKIENMSFEDAQDLPYVLFEKFKEIYPERCPVEKKETTSAPLQPKLLEEIPKQKKSQKNENQPSLF